MLRTTLLAAATLVAFGATAAYAGSDGGYGHKGHDRDGHGGYEQNHVPGPYAGRYRHYREHYGAKRDYRYGRSWFDYRGRPYCRLAPRKVPIKVWDRRGNSYRKWVWKDVRVCV
ncbi:hypothetical protein [Methyloceanibacter caenitepidi]|uniref:Uncharacterized protein n=1 Tax=Methyloceanibacter caenitepidi TaxID=1384459 RepID=A0A0A8K1U6_9HYPH|nr:hypothetical protein [Methyloceanibacter caenitepidi]BAQ16497.1 hypothetical protein GL4_1037 [Methyloceanibacter caenitepidi]